jgi:hypothetical protein
MNPSTGVDDSSGFPVDGGSLKPGLGIEGTTYHCGVCGIHSLEHPIDGGHDGFFFALALRRCWR